MQKFLAKIFFWMKKDAAEGSKQSQRLFLSGVEERMTYTQGAFPDLRSSGSSSKQGSSSKRTEQKPSQSSSPSNRTGGAGRFLSKLGMKPNSGKGKAARGKVKWFNNQKGYGFIVPDNSEAEIFVHYSTIKSEGYKTLNAGQAVEFEIVKGDKGDQAQNVIKV